MGHPNQHTVAAAAAAHSAAAQAAVGGYHPPTPPGSHPFPPVIPGLLPSFPQLPLTPSSFLSPERSNLLHPTPLNRGAGLFDSHSSPRVSSSHQTISSDTRDLPSGPDDKLACDKLGQREDRKLDCENVDVVGDLVNSSDNEMIVRQGPSS